MAAILPRQVHFDWRPVPGHVPPAHLEGHGDAHSLVHTHDARRRARHDEDDERLLYCPSSTHRVPIAC